ncbi:MAG TPA: hypothetical protein VF604_08635 [Pyrinomonadaceae bacterium]|jgi:hypothetical protein
MRIRYFLPFVLVTFLFSVSAFAESSSKAKELARQAASENQTEAVSAINQLRALRQEGLDALFETYAADIKRFGETGEATDEWKRVAFAIDGVAMQKDAYASHLFWFTDLEQAKIVAKAKNKPILSLRLLGNLNEEFSCANSRFFRAVLYSNAEISRVLRENYVLHWKSVRPAPKVTIDFGDGRKIERTLTGNSIHYLLDDSGAIIDALPGLYSPQGFLKYITQAEKVNRIINGATAADKEKAMLRFRRLMFNDILAKRNKAVAAAKVKLTEPKNGTTAIDVAPRAMAKMMVTDEISILRGISDDFSRYEPQINFDGWNKLAQIYTGGTKIDAESLAFIRRQNAKTGLSETEFTSLVEKLEKFIALDTARNDFLFHPKLYAWLNQNSITDVETFNARVYAEIFKTPDSDKWLGMYAPDVYTALDGGGIIK